MNRQQLEHIIRAAGEIADDDIVIVGSQAILGAFPDPPPSLLRSMEADVYPLHDPAGADRIDAAIGDLSPFHDSYGYYAHGVGHETAKAPAGWQRRLVRVDSESVIMAQRTRSGWCIEPHDLMLAKLARGEQRDWDFVETSVRAGLVEPAVLRERASTMPERFREGVAESLEGVLARARAGA
jgi:hypothetical protein